MLSCTLSEAQPVGVLTVMSLAVLWMCTVKPAEDRCWKEAYKLHVLLHAVHKTRKGLAAR
jgi:hypothetical protein